MIIIIIGSNGSNPLPTGERAPFGPAVTLTHGDQGSFSVSCSEWTRLCSADHGASYFSNYACGWLGMVWASYWRKTENGPRTWRLLYGSQHHQTHFFPQWKCHSLIQGSRNFIPKRPTHNKPALNQKMAWWREADERLSEAVTVLYTDAYMCHLPRWIFGSITMFYTISHMFCVYVCCRHIDPIVYATAHALICCGIVDHFILDSDDLLFISVLSGCFCWHRAPVPAKWPSWV